MCVGTLIILMLETYICRRVNSPKPVRILRGGGVGAETAASGEEDILD